MSKRDRQNENENQGELAPKPESSLAIPMDDLYAQQGSGMEEVGSDDLAIPYLSIVQKSSARVDPVKEEYDPNAVVGDFHNTVTDEYTGGEQGLRVIPCYFRMCYVENGPGKKGKFVAEHPAGTDLVTMTSRNQDGQDVLPNENVLVRTARHYVFIVDTHEPVVITMRSTQLKASKKWNSLLAGRKMVGPEGKPFTPPTFSSVWRLKTVPQENEHGSWHGFDITPDGDLKDIGLYEMARDFSAMVNGGEVREVGELDE